MIENQKIVRDPIHGNIKLTGPSIDLLETPEVQRLYNVKQLGFAHLVFPGAHHTRFEHSLGAYAMAEQVTDILQLPSRERELITCAALLHDIGHGPFSHTLESILLEKIGVDHIDLTKKLILGEYEIVNAKEKQFIHAPSVPQILSRHEINERELISIIQGKTYKKAYLSQLLNSTIDVDQLDYLIRDAYYTGVAYGMIDVQRLLQTLVIHAGNLMIQRKGISSVENILMARALMYSSVYFHKTVRIAELMLSKALEECSEAEPFNFFRMTDAEIMSALPTMGSYQLEIATRLKYRELFKQAYVASEQDLNKDELKMIKRLEQIPRRKEKEQELEEIFHIPKGHVILDVPRPELLRSEPRIHKTDIEVIDRDEVRSLDDFTPIAKAIRSRVAPDWVVMIVTEEKYREKVAKKVASVLFH